MRWLFSDEHGELSAVSTGNDAALARMGVAFLKACAQSAESRWGALEALAEALDDGQRRVAALRLVHWMRRQPLLEIDPPIRVVRVPLETASVRSHLDLVLVPSVFEPEDWGYTFLEGLLRRPSKNHGEQVLAEIGTGTGWISLAMLLHAGVERAVGYDINPIAIKISRINAIINSYNDDLSPRYDAQRRLLHERFEARESDLLSAAIDAKQRFDLIVGCIPQVLAPSPDLDPSRALEQGDESRLYDLSNYFVLQGVYEDQFGLGLLAKALDQAVQVMDAGARVVLNIAGRPGSAVIERMFTRRGFEPQVTWSTRVQQAADTDIEVLARLEARTGQPFEFYVGRHSREAIGAATAQALREAGRPIWHDVRVYEASLRHESDMRAFFEAVRDLDGEDLLDQLDLSRIDGEQISYLKALSERLLKGRRAPYTHEEGGVRLRAHVSAYLERFYALSGGPGSIFIGPCREEVLHGVLRATCAPGSTVLVSASIAPVYAAAFDKAGVKPLVGNDDLEELVELVEALSPSLVALCLTPDERRNSAALRRLLASTADRGVPVVFDGSDDFVITSRQHRNALLDFLAREGLPPHAMALVGLVANRVYPHLQPALLIGDLRGPLLEALVAFAEATYSRNNTFAEHYYEHLFEEILSFQLRRPGQAHQTSAPASQGAPALSEAIKAVMDLPAFDSPPPYSGAQPLLRMDYGENELPMPGRLIKGILLGFTNLGDDISPGRTREAVAGFCRALMGWPVDGDGILLGAGVFPLLYDMTLALTRRLGRPLRVALPQGHYGYLPPIFALAGCDIVEVHTRIDEGYLLGTEGLDAAERDGGPIDVLFMNNPTNPVGIVYPTERLEALAEWADARDVYVFSDEIFSLLILGEHTPDRGPSFFDVVADKPGLRGRLVAFSGLSKAFAAGGLRVGWAASEDAELLASARRLRTVSLARHAHAACEALLRGFRGEEPTEGAEEVLLYLREMRETLSGRRDRVVATFMGHGIGLHEGEPAALFVFPDMRPLIGRHFVTESGERVLLEESNLTHIIREHAGLQLNPGRWAAAPGHARACFSLTEDAFEVAVRRLGWFLDRVS